MLYKCHSCGSSMVYDPDRKKLVCPYCGTERADMPQGKFTDGKMCPNCGAPLTGTERALVTMCPYCGTWLSIDTNLREADAPKRIQPFSFGKIRARQRILDAFDNVPFLPRGFLADPEGKDIEALYAPFWLYPVQVRGHYEYKAEITLPRGGGRTEHQKYHLSRDGFSQFYGVPVDAMESLEDLTTDAAVGGEGKSLQDFDPVYLSGTSAELPEKPADDAGYRLRAADWACKSAAEKKDGIVGGFTAVKCTSQYEEYSLNPADAQSVLLPVYRYEYSGFGRHKIYIDGNTGNMSGDAPCDKGRVLLHYLIEMVCAGITLAAVVGIVGVLL